MNTKNKILLTLLAILCVFVFIAFFLQNWILLKIFVLGASVLATVICYPHYVQYKAYPEESFFYIFICILAASSAFVCLFALLPDCVNQFIELNSGQFNLIIVYLQVLSIFIIGVRILFQKEKWHKNMIILCWLLLAILLFGYLYVFYKRITMY